MKVYNFKPGVALAGYVDRILVIEHCENSTPFSLPLFANGSPTLLFISAKGSMKPFSPKHCLLAMVCI
ncbi:hypothetical protein [Pedobacter heparinus]|uniref:Uncharacterized protein n=1 Tax=Pedobacter heparinus (strain ATCC 13125 / DSM 2366 / CIP 104194 / JCM 7457 / NBRC 12017 / NCIMB 9290 / NRRL B-14731 / HIM 762-3) TaxID=485917 RepID=C6XSR4_PEDHD|nr:hypothetical protein [Pedobacter heparinus]ACU05627.1 hypothetical protein Phep_3434 [Pedobacter heparinus DSM 2366]